MGPLEPKTHSVIVLDPEVVHNKILQLKCLIIIHIINNQKKKIRFLISAKIQSKS